MEILSEVGMYKISKAQFEQLVANPQLAVAERTTTLGQNHMQRHVLNKHGHIIAAKIINSKDKRKET